MPLAIQALDPGIIVVELGVNDNDNGITAAQTQANMETLLAAYRAPFANPPPFLLLADYNAYGYSGTSDATWQQYVSALYAVAAGDSQVDILDLSLRMPSTGAANTWGLYYSDNLHPASNGHAMIADALCSFLSPA